MKSPDRRPYAWLEDDFGTNFGRKQESLQPRIDRTPAIRNPLLQPFRNVPDKVSFEKWQRNIVLLLLFTLRII